MGLSCLALLFCGGFIEFGVFLLGGRGLFNSLCLLLGCGLAACVGLLWLFWVLRFVC